MTRMSELAQVGKEGNLRRFMDGATQSQLREKKPKDEPEEAYYRRLLKEGLDDDSDW